MVRIASLAWCGIVSCVLLWNPPAVAEDDFQSLFNGRDLSGWEGNTDLWSVEDGAITGRTKGPDHLAYNQFLIWRGGTVRDFELRLEVRLEGDNNSGVQYRSQQLPDAGDFVVAGYQADLHVRPQYTGMLYDERGRGILAERGQHVVCTKDARRRVTQVTEPNELKAVDLGDWHELTVIAQGNRLIHKLDGEVTVEVVDQDERAREREGILALQVHRGPAMLVQFRNIRLKTLPAAGDAADDAEAKPGKSGRAGDSKPDGKPAAGGKSAGSGKSGAGGKSPAGGKSAAKRPRPELARPAWIWQNENGQPRSKVYFRKEFQVRGSVAAARLVATCDNLMTVYLDGKPILSHDDFTQPAFKDLTAAFETPTEDGRHVLAVEGENVGENNPAGLLVKLDFESGWRDAWSVVSDASWQVAATAEEGWKQPGFAAEGWSRAEVVAPLGGGPWTQITATALAAAAPLREPTATPAESLKVAKDFRVELLYSVPKSEQGSWVNLCPDPKGRLIVSDQYGGLYRVTPPPIGTEGELKIEKIPVDLGEAQGLLWAFDSLYVVVNRGQKYDSGLYRVWDTDGDDQLDTVKYLRALTGGGEHGPHAILPAGDGKSLYIVCGNQTQLTDLDRSRVPRVWDEDLLLPRTYGRGFMKGVPAPGGYIARIDPDGKHWELVASGFRNEFDAALNADGELFTYDADMEWDMNTPWYRPTRVCHVVSGAEFGWRNGGGKWPAHYPDSLPAVVNIGPGSPTGICFGYGAKFPGRYQNALFISDWSYGKLYAVHLEPAGASYTAELEEFVTGTPLPLTDVIVNPHDGAMYFAIGGRRVQSGLYRVTYQGAESTAEVTGQQPGGRPLRAVRKELEQFHVGDHPQAVERAWPYLGHEDRFIRFAARVAIEQRPVAQWRQRALEETNPRAAITALLALARQYPRLNRPKGPELDSPPPRWDDPSTTGDNGSADEPDQAADEPDQAAGGRDPVRRDILAALGRIDWSGLDVDQRVDLLRTYAVAMTRLGPPDQATRQELIARFDAVTPTHVRELDSELAQLLVYLQAPTAAAKVVGLLQAAPTQEEQIDYAKTLRHLRAGWTDPLRETYFGWFVRAAGYRGGASFSLFVDHIKQDAVALLSESEKQRLKPVLEARPAGEVTPLAAQPRPFVQDWKLQELLPLVQSGLRGRDFEKGRTMFAAANCFACHRFDNQGGAIGPDLTALSGRFSPRDILESIVEPSKVISDQYQAVTIVTIDGKVVTGRIVNLAGDSLRINTNMLDPNAQVGIDRKQIDEMSPSKTSMMPAGLLNTLNEEDILDLMAYLLSRGDRNHPMFQK